MADIRPTVGDTDWFQHDRFGLFIHWGLYALAARHEWVQSKEMIDPAAYEDRYFRRFDPDLYDPDRWAELAQRAGMKYFVITTKHHEGFCLWDSKHTDYKAPNTPGGRDLLRPMVDAFRSRGLRTGFYHSLIDWHHPHYVVDYITHPLRNALPPEESAAAIRGGNTFDRYEKGKDVNAGRDQQKYADYLHNQVRELLTEFDPVDILWFDFSYVRKPDGDRLDHTWNKGREAWRSEELVKMIRELAPNVILNDRLDLPNDHPDRGDVKTPEQYQPTAWPEVDGQRVVWEACQTFSGSWGYFRDEKTWRSTRQLIFTLIDCVSKGGNLLLNVGPTGRGEFDYRAVDRLEGIGNWMQYHSRAIHGCTEAPADFPTPEHSRLTYDPAKGKLYVHLLQWPYKNLVLAGKGFLDRVEYAQLMHDASEIGIARQSAGDNPAGHTRFAAGQDAIVLHLPQDDPPGIEIPVVELHLKK